MDAPYIRTKCQQFTSDTPCSSFKKLIVSTPRLLQNLHTMSLAKAVPDGLKDHKCTKIASCERPPIPYVLQKDCVQEMVSVSRTTISICGLAKLWSYKILSGTQVHARYSSPIALPLLERARGNCLLRR
jgi:hypothetical protein